MPLPLNYDLEQFHISCARRSEGDASPARFAFCFIRFNGDGLVFQFFIFIFVFLEEMSVGWRAGCGVSKSSVAAARCIYIMCVQLETPKGGGGLMEMGIGVDYRDRIAPLRE